MKLPVLAQAVLAALAFAPLVSFADETIPGNLTVEQNLLVHQKVEIGEATIGASILPGYSLQANSTLGTTILDQTGHGEVVYWNWIHYDETHGVHQMMRLEPGKLSLYGPSSFGAPIIELDAVSSTPQITIAGKKVVTEGNIGTILAENSDGYGRLVLGKAASANYDHSTALGAFANANEYGSSAIGMGASAGEWSSAIGMAAFAGIFSNALGSYAYAGGEYSNAIGVESVASDFSSAIGMGAFAGYSSNALGYYAYAYGDHSNAIGVGTKTISAYQVALGAYNDPLEDAFFMIGKGSGEMTYQNNKWVVSRSNLFVIMKDGRGIFRSTTYTEPTTPTTVQPKEALTVQGAATIDGAATITGDTTVKGALRVIPSGDLPMGIFTSGEQP